MRSILGWVISKTLNMLPVATLLGAQNFKASIGEMPVMLVTYVHPDLIKANRTTSGGGGGGGTLFFFIIGKHLLNRDFVI